MLTLSLFKCGFHTVKKTVVYVGLCKTYFVDRTNLHQAATVDLTMMVREKTASKGKHSKTYKTTEKCLLFEKVDTHKTKNLHLCPTDVGTSTAGCSTYFHQ